MVGDAQHDAWKRQTVRRLPPALERRTHIALADLLRHTARTGWWWSHIPSGEYRTEATGALLKRMGLQRGMADFLFIDDEGRHYWLELKRGSAPLTCDQEYFAQTMRWRSVPYAVARDYDAAVRQLKLWGVL